MSRCTPQVFNEDVGVDQDVSHGPIALIVMGARAFHGTADQCQAISAKIDALYGQEMKLPAD
ncbi:MAG TPA: hypothetical protein VME46_03520 [Acidimicrobiales bacterium]|nr:hypothetical protein [Acidimicrobiales bacterium]